MQASGQTIGPSPPVRHRRSVTAGQSTQQRLATRKLPHAPIEDVESEWTPFMGGRVEQFLFNRKPLVDRREPIVAERGGVSVERRSSVKLMGHHAAGSSTAARQRRRHIRMRCVASNRKGRPSLRTGRPFFWSDHTWESEIPQGATRPDASSVSVAGGATQAVRPGGFMFPFSSDISRQTRVGSAPPGMASPTTSLCRTVGTRPPRSSTLRAILRR